MFTHHLTEYMDISEFDIALESLDDIILRYKDLETSKPNPELKRFKPETWEADNLYSNKFYSIAWYVTVLNHIYNLQGYTEFKL